ncbi:MAG: efflux RND transporter periplasmic adaptor subunit [Pirellulaceae bacterium]|nr:efflux RND transporter periplasmic adaptor subunit [Pirellulaceae bacterium]MDP6723484.1 efflux RND transporter periplasmic adaptor subunit [Pirellulaceae bacterium]
MTVAKPVQKTVTNFLEETGETEPVELVAIRARVPGYLEEIKFQAGADVEAGDVLYVIQQREFKAKVDSAKAEAKSMEVAFRLAEIEFKRQTNLIADNATAQSKVDQAEAARDGAIAAVEAAKAALDQALLDFEYTQVKTPITGRVGKTIVKIGNLVGESEATHLTTVVSYDPIYVNFNISERALLRASRRPDGESAARPDITTIKAYIRRATDKGFPFEGHLEYADLGVDQSTGTFMIRGIFPNPNMQIFPGLFVRIRIPLGVTENAVLVPERALGADQAGRFAMIVGEDNIVERRNVEIGAKYDDMVVVSDGLNGNELVVIDGIQRSRPGAKVSPKETQLSEVEGELEDVEEGSQSPIEDESAVPTPDESK